MADLTDAESAQSVKIVGASGSGTEANFASVDSNNNLKAISPAHALNDGAEPTYSQLVAGSDGTNLRPLATDELGRLITTALTGFNSGFNAGYVATAATTQVRVNATTYTEQTANAQRSVSSANANDTAAGTGARTVEITYFTVTGTGPFTETITLNGTTAVNTVATNICFIESMVVKTAGSTGVNAGIVRIYTTTGGGGSIFASIAAGDNRTFYAHHHVAAGEELKVTGLSCSHNGTVVGSGALFRIFARDLVTSNAALTQVSDFVRLYGQSSTFSRLYQSPIVVLGPAIVYVTVTPESTSSLQYRAAIDYFQP
jgi:hypothetical protein